jgi:hypothetical protein
VALLAVAYLLSWQEGVAVSEEGEGSVLWEVEAGLAGLLFKGGEDDSTVSH